MLLFTKFKCLRWDRERSEKETKEVQLTDLLLDCRWYPMISLLLPTYSLPCRETFQGVLCIVNIPLYPSRLFSAFHRWTSLSSEFGLVNLFGTSLGSIYGGPYCFDNNTHHSRSHQPIHFSGWSPRFCLHSSLASPYHFLPKHFTRCVAT